MPAISPNKLLGVERTPNAFATAIQDVCVNHRRFDIFVPKQLLHRTNVVTIFQ